MAGKVFEGLRRLQSEACASLRRPRKRPRLPQHVFRGAQKVIRAARTNYERCPTFNGAAGRAVGKTRISYSKPGDESSVSKDGCGIMERRRSDL